MSASDALELAERALALAGGGDEVQVTVTRERSLFSRFARSAPTQATDVDDLTVHVLVVCDGQTGTATTNGTGDDALRGTASRAREVASAAAATGRGAYPGLPSPAEYAAHDGHDAATAALDPGVAADALRAAFAVAAEHETEAFGLWSAAEVVTAIASSRGVRAVDAVTDAYLKVICRSAVDGRSGFDAAAAVAASDIDPLAVARAAAARVGRGPVAELPPGTWPVVLGEDAIALLLSFLGGLAFNGLPHAEGRGALAGRLGTTVASPLVTVTDEPRAAGSLPRAFDFEAVPKVPITLIRDGVAERVVHDSRSAALENAVSTGHAMLPGGSPFGAAPTNLLLAPGDAESAAALATRIERGIYVTRFWYVNPVHAKETLLTGVTRDGTFLIEDGEITRPLRDMRFTDSALGVLERVEAIGATPRLVSESEFYGRRFATGTLCPPVRASGLRLTGGA